MTRHDYRPSQFTRLTGDATALLTLVRFRLPFAFVGAASLLVALVWQIEQQRIGALERDTALMQQRVAIAAVDAQHTQRLIAIVARDRHVAQRIATVHGTAIASANAIAMIGNVLPHQTWLTNVAAATSGSWTISGRSTHVTEIGTTLKSIQQLDRSGTARLLSVAATGRTNAVLDFVIGWERQP